MSGLHLSEFRYNRAMLLRSRLGAIAEKAPGKLPGHPII